MCTDYNFIKLFQFSLTKPESKYQTFQTGEFKPTNKTMKFKFSMTYFQPNTWLLKLFAQKSKMKETCLVWSSPTQRRRAKVYLHTGHTACCRQSWLPEHQHHWPQHHINITLPSSTQHLNRHVGLEEKKKISRTCVLNWIQQLYSKHILIQTVLGCKRPGFVSLGKFNCD